MKASYQKWGGKEKVEEYVVSLYRKLRPQVVLSHDLRGEYGHPAHIMTARAAKILSMASTRSGSASGRRETTEISPSERPCGPVSGWSRSW